MKTMSMSTDNVTQAAAGEERERGSGACLLWFLSAEPFRLAGSAVPTCGSSTFHWVFPLFSHTHVNPYHHAF